MHICDVRFGTCEIEQRRRQQLDSREENPRALLMLAFTVDRLSRSIQIDQIEYRQTRLEVNFRAPKLMYRIVCFVLEDVLTKRPPRLSFEEGCMLRKPRCSSPTWVKITLMRRSRKMSLLVN